MTITSARIGSFRPNEKRPKEGAPLNKNLWFVSSKEARSTYVFLVILLHAMLLSMPFLNTSQAWTLTNLLHAVVSTNKFITNLPSSKWLLYLNVCFLIFSFFRSTTTFSTSAKAHRSTNTTKENTED